MVKKRSLVSKICISILLVIIVFNVAAHVLIFGTQVTSFMTSGSAEFSSIKEKYSSYDIYSLYAIIVEIFILILIMIIKFVRLIFGGKHGFAEKKRQETKKVVISIHPSSSRTKTDLDLLYSALKDNKRIKVSDIAQSFNVSEELVLEWGKILESGGLAEINYPRFGKAEISIMEVENEKKD